MSVKDALAIARERRDYFTKVMQDENWRPFRLNIAGTLTNLDQIIKLLEESILPDFKPYFKWIVIHTGHDRWSGPELIDTKPFVTHDEAVAYADNINSKNTASSAPEYYERAEVQKIPQNIEFLLKHIHKE